MPEPACGLCGAPAPPPFRAPPPELAPELDLRPGEPARSTLSRWVLTCRSCGACAPDLAVLPAEAAATHADEGAEAILAFQRARIAARDAGRHLISSALRPPARTPHVAHGRAVKPAFWSRWFRR